MGDSIDLGLRCLEDSIDLGRRGLGDSIDLGRRVGDKMDLGHMVLGGFGFDLGHVVFGCR